MILVAAFWLCAQRLTRDTRAPLVPPLRLVRVDRSHLSLTPPRRSRHAQ